MKFIETQEVKNIKILEDIDLSNKDKVLVKLYSDENFSLDKFKDYEKEFNEQEYKDKIANLELNDLNTKWNELSALSAEMLKILENDSLSFEYSFSTVVGNKKNLINNLKLLIKLFEKLPWNRSSILQYNKSYGELQKNINSIKLNSNELKIELSQISAIFIYNTLINFTGTGIIDGQNYLQVVNNIGHIFTELNFYAMKYYNIIKNINTFMVMIETKIKELNTPKETSEKQESEK